MRRLGLVSAALVAVAILSVPQLFSQDKAKTTAEPAKTEAKKEPKGRLPNNFGKLGLSDEQKDKVYAVQAKYAEEIARLQKQLAEVRAKVKVETEALLTADQKTKLAGIVAETQKKIEEAKKQDSKPAAEAPKAEPKPTTK